MKRQIFFWAAVICLTTAAIMANGQTTDPFEKGIVDSVTIEHPIFAKVFPGVQFMIVTSGISLPPQQRIYGYFGGERFGMTWDINLLYDGVKERSRATENERVEAFMRLEWWLWDTELEIINLENVNIEKYGTLYTHRAVVNLRYLKPEKEQFEMLVQIYQDQIRRAEIYKEGHRRWVIKPILLGFADDVLLQIGGMGVQSESYSGRTHYYLVVSENEILTGHYYRFTLSGWVARPFRAGFIITDNS